ncbi:MAG: protein kinase, partial [Myxococcales bacterium]|nr:protein kinase [Myxococcales bacterium]
LVRGTPYLVFGSFDPQSLAETVRRTPPNAMEAAHIVHSIAVGLAAAHASSVVHGDISPESILVRRRRDGALAVRLHGFGMAHVFHPGARAYFDPTWRPYVAPEVYGSLHLAGPADIYSLGAVLFLMLTGAPPPETDSSFLGQEGPRPAEGHPWVPTALDDLTSRCLSSRAAVRPTADALCQELGRIRRALRTETGLGDTLPPDEETFIVPQRGWAARFARFFGRSRS